ncbi:MAG: IS3 family transposase [Methylocystaceae bacterium]
MRSSLKYSVIYRFKDKYPIKQMCEFFQVSRSGYYAWVKRIGQEDKDKWIADLICECQYKNHKTYGYRRVGIWLLREYGLILNHKTVLRIMSKYQLQSEIRRRRKYQQNSQVIHKYENLLNRNFTAEKPNQKWVTDISYIHTKQGVLYLSMIKDLYDGFIVHYETGTEQTTGLVTKTIKSALKKEAVADGLALHSDQGFQYTSTAYFNLSQEYGFKPSMSRRGNCLDNACAESFFGALKAECIHRRKLATYEEARNLLNDYISYYNYDRIQLKTKLTPYERRCQPV